MTPQEKQWHVFDAEGRERKIVADQTLAEQLADNLNGVVIMTIPHQVILVDHVPSCNFCSEPGEYDFPTRMGPWANGCEKHWIQYRTSAKLGTGMGQKWVQRPKYHGN